MKEAFLIGCYPDTPEKIKVMLTLLDELLAMGIPIILSSHYVIPAELQAKVDYVIYDKNNPMDDRVRLTQWYTMPNVMVYRPWEEEYHAPAGMLAVQNGVDFCKGKFARIYFQEYDVSLNLDLYIQKVRALSKPFVFFNWLGDPNSIATNVYAFQTEYFNKLWKFPIYTCDDYLYNVAYAASKTDGNRNIIIEGLGKKLLQASGLDHYIFTDEERLLLMRNYSLCEAPSKHKAAKVWVCYAKGNKAVLFVINHSPQTLRVNIESKWLNVNYVSPPANDEVHPHTLDCKWWIIEREGRLHVSMGEDVDKWYDFNAPEIINEATFKFVDDRVVQEVASTTPDFRL